MLKRRERQPESERAALKILWSWVQIPGFCYHPPALQFFSNTYHLIERGPVLLNVHFPIHLGQPRWIFYAPDLEISMAVNCPHCGSSRVATKNYGRKAGSIVGTVAGAAGGYARAVVGSEIGSTLGAVAGPVGMVAGGVAGALLGALLGGAAGCATGAAVGQLVDETLADNYVCMDCHYSFSAGPTI